MFFMFFFICKVMFLTSMLDMITPLIRRQDTMLREAITPYEMLALTLRIYDGFMIAS